MVLSAILVAGIARAEPGEILWEDRIDRGIDSGNVVVADAERVFALGYSQPGVPLFNTPFVRCFDVRTGALLWERQFTEPGIPHVAELHGKRLFMAGQDVFVRALDSETGQVRWERDPDGDVHGIAISEGRVIVGGLRTFALPPRPGSREPRSNTDALVAAYDARDGSLLWEDVADSGSLAFDGAYAVAAHADRVFAAGGTYGADHRTLRVRAYDAGSGALLWQDSEEESALAWAVAARGRQVFVAGERDLPDRTTMPFVRAYDADGGALQWETARAPAFPAIGTFIDVAAEEDRVYAAGADGSFLVVALDRGTGAVAWLRRSEERGQAAALASAGGRLFASGWLFASAPPYRASGFTEAYDAASGAPVWSGRLDGKWSLARAQAATRGRLVVIGDSAGDFVVRTYRAR